MLLAIVWLQEKAGLSPGNAKREPSLGAGLSLAASASPMG